MQHPPATVPDSATAEPTSPAPTSKDPARFAPLVRGCATAAGINPQLLMAILYIESDKPHNPALERSWQQVKPEAGFGVVNMHRAAFDLTKRDRHFADREWDELPSDPALAIEAAAWHLHDLAVMLPDRPARPEGRFTRDELLALGYNTGVENMLAFARGTEAGPHAQSYVDRLRANWAAADEAVRRADVTAP